MQLMGRPPVNHLNRDAHGCHVLNTKLGTGKRLSIRIHKEMEIDSSEDQIFENDFCMNQSEDDAEKNETEDPLTTCSISEASFKKNETPDTKMNTSMSGAGMEFLNGFSDDLFIALDEQVNNEQTNPKSAGISKNSKKMKISNDSFSNSDSVLDSDIMFGLFDDASDDDNNSNLVDNTKPGPGSILTNVNARPHDEEAKTKLESNPMFSHVKSAKDIQQEYTGPKPEDENFCCICMDEHSNPKTLTKCSHSFCTDCIDEHFKIKPTCPVCFVAYGVITGNQPEGYMSDCISKTKLPGYEGSNTIIISYGFSDGIQSSEHPNPGQQYHGTSRTAYLPNNAEGQKVLKLLKVAFKRRITFTVGRSRTTGCDNVVTWNDIHHKTSTHGGQECFGYPDATYLQRVQEELAAFGITEQSLEENLRH